MEYPIITWVAGSFNIEAYCKGYIMVMIKSMCFLYLVMAHFSFCMQLESIIACNGSCLVGLKPTMKEHCFWTDRNIAFILS